MGMFSEVRRSADDDVTGKAVSIYNRREEIESLHSVNASFYCYSCIVHMTSDVSEDL
jgi:hypothetical protein